MKLKTHTVPCHPTGDGGADGGRSVYRRFCASPTDDSAYTEWCLMCMTNQGDLNVFTLPELRRQMHEDSIRREDIQ